jgi:hypothetical protein
LIVPDFPDQPVADLFALMLQEDSIVLSKELNEGSVVVQVGDREEKLTPTQAHQLADGYEDSLQKDEAFGTMESEEVVRRLRDYADAVEPYRDDAE